MERECPNCSKAISSSAQFCRYCGTSLVGQAAPRSLTASVPSVGGGSLHDNPASTPKQIEGERKLVTVLFTDIVNSTGLAETMDPEEWSEIVSGAHERVSQSVYRYDGTIAQLLGDGALAFFGAPVAHEDDPIRAVKAAIELLALIGDYSRSIEKARGIRIQMRVGIHTGLVVVGNVGNDLHMEYLAIGDTVNLASRLQSAALPNTVFVSTSTERKIRPIFETESRGLLTLKGKSEPVPVFHVLGPRAIPEPTRGITGLHSPLVGRERERQSLMTALNKLMNGNGQIVSVMGEAGLGKSRLVAETREAFSTEVLWLEARSLSYQAAIPYAPLINLIERSFGLNSQESDLAQYALVRDRLAESLGDRASDIGPFFAYLLRLALPEADLARIKYLQPPQLREGTFGAVESWLGGLAERQRVVVVFEDLHWVDPTSLDLILRLMSLTKRTPLMIISVFRPQQQETSWRFHTVAVQDYADRYTPITLEPLDDASTRTLVANLLEIEDLPESVRTLILDKAEGNPFFVEEVIRSLLDSHWVVREDSRWRATREIVNLQLPDTLAGVIGARLDRLDGSAKQAAQNAAVIGREFQARVLAHVSQDPGALDQALTVLEQHELVREKGRVPELVYLFRHALTQEAAYDSILMSKRRELHRRVAECLERLDRDRVNEIARHYWEAREPERALPFLVASGERAGRAYSNAEAIRYFTQALDVLKTKGDATWARRAYEGLGSALTLSYDMPRAMENYRAMLEHGRNLNSIPMQVSALNKWANLLMWMGQFREVETLLAQAEQLAREDQDGAGLVEMYTVRCGVCTSVGDFEGAVRYLGESIQVGRQSNQKEQMAFGLTHTANTLIFLTRFEDAWRTAQEAYQVAQEAGDRQHIAEILVGPFALYHLRNGDMEAAHQSAQQGVDLAAKSGLLFAESLGTWVLGMIARLRGEHETAISSFRRSLDAARSSGFPMTIVLALGSLGIALLETSHAFAQEASEFHAQALQIMENPFAASSGGATWADLGYSALEVGNTEKAKELFQKGLTIPTIYVLLMKPYHLLGLAQIALAHSEMTEATRLVEQARGYVEERQMRYLYPLVALVGARVSLACGSHERALDQFTQAERLALDLHMRPCIWQARIGAAQVLQRQSKTKEAQAQQDAARAMQDEIAGLFRDARLRSLYLQRVMSQADSRVA